MTEKMTKIRVPVAKNVGFGDWGEKTRAEMVKIFRLYADDMRPREAKKWGTTIPIRQDWEDVNLDIMRELTRKKFSHPSFAKKLLDTGDIVIEETNYWHDTFWGVCNGIGENWLGKILMEVREELKNNV